MKHLLLLILVFSSTYVCGQNQKHNPNDQLRSMNWDVIGSVNFELSEKNQLLPIFSEVIKRFQNREFDLRGYMIPIKNGKNHQKFLLSTLPINQCYFCGKNGVPVMIMIELNTPIPYSEKPVHVKGILKLEQNDATYAPPIIIKNGKLIV